MREAPAAFLRLPQVPAVAVSGAGGRRDRVFPGVRWFGARRPRRGTPGSAAAALARPGSVQPLEQPFWLGEGLSSGADVGAGGEDPAGTRRKVRQAAAGSSTPRGAAPAQLSLLPASPAARKRFSAVGSCSVGEGYRLACQDRFSSPFLSV